MNNGKNKLDELIRTVRDLEPVISKDESRAMLEANAARDARPRRANMFNISIPLKAAAAVLLVALAGGGYLFFMHAPNKESITNATAPTTSAAREFATPYADSAMQKKSLLARPPLPAREIIATGDPADDTKNISIDKLLVPDESTDLVCVDPEPLKVDALVNPGEPRSVALDTLSDGR